MRKETETPGCEAGRHSESLTETCDLSSEYLWTGQARGKVRTSRKQINNHKIVLEELRLIGSRVGLVEWLK
jgi:hypothetical protein